jgi:hypothetical protein
MAKAKHIALSIAQHVAAANSFEQSAIKVI